LIINLYRTYALKTYLSFQCVSPIDNKSFFMRTYVSFDWAIKKLLRDKANFDILEGFFK